MSKENAKQFLESYRNNEQAMKLLLEKPRPDSLEEAISLLAEVAVEVGFQTTPEEIADALTELQEARKTQTNDAVNKMEKLEDDDLEDVAGGVYYYTRPDSSSDKQCYSGQDFIRVEGCLYDFTDSTCSVADACDYFYRIYFDCYVSVYSPGTENYCNFSLFSDQRNKSYPK